MIDFTKPVTTESGCPFKIFTTEARDTDYPVRGEFFKDGEWHQGSWTKDGYYDYSRIKHRLNLINPPEEIEGFFNMYRSSATDFFAYRHSCMDEAIKNRASNCIATIPIKFKEGEGL